MFLSKRVNGYWYVFYASPTGKKTCISTKTKIKREAFRFLSTFERELKQRIVNRVIPISLKDFSFQYLKYSESIHRPKTSKALKTIFTQLNKFLGYVELSEISTKNIKDFLLLKSNISVYTAQKYLAYLRSALNKAITDNYLLTNPCSRIDNYKIPEKQPLYFSELDYEILLSTIDNSDLRDFVSFALLTGLRQMELITLTWTQIDFKSKILTLDNRNHLTKSKKIRTIPLGIKALQILNDRQMKSNLNIVFSYHDQPIKQDFISKKFKKYVIRAKLNPRLNFHSLRHTFASWLVQRGVSIYEVSKLLGHSDIKVTEIYSHLRTEDLRASVEKLNN